MHTDKTSNDGGPAFPTDNYNGGVSSTGMTLRDYFAAAAFPEVDRRSHGTPEQIASECYMLADAMLKARGGAK